ncbi:ABC transporter transmembrane domain-containing protein [Paenibacillus piscarius]|uniref:ABC transporter transmembrane domain-containing protein n=1 Tax=Paenibacillus piscarius TaxID=1089681 RepID=UPI001EE7F209|nr:ABC transporter ATP-binding protein [Paenibacillus piscarius]
MNPIRTLIKEILSNSKRILVMILLFNISAALVSTIQPLLFKNLFDDILPDKQIGTAALYIILLILIPIVYAALNSATSYYNNELGNHLSRQLRLRLFTHLLETRPRNVDSIGRGEIINRITTQVGMLCEVFVVDTLMSIVSNAILLTATFLIMFSMSVELTLASIITFPLCMYGFRRFRSKTEKLDEQYYCILDKGMNFADTVISLITSIIYGYSLYLILKGRISPGTLLAFIVILPRLYNIFKSLFTLNIDRSRMTVIINNLNEILNLKTTESGPKRVT